MTICLTSNCGLITSVWHETEAVKRGVDAGRILFGTTLPKAQYLRRGGLAVSSLYRTI